MMQSNPNNTKKKDEEMEETEGIVLVASYGDLKVFPYETTSWAAQVAYDWAKKNQTYLLDEEEYKEHDRCELVELVEKLCEATGLMQTFHRMDNKKAIRKLMKIADKATMDAVKVLTEEGAA